MVGAHGLVCGATVGGRHFPAGFGARREFPGTWMQVALDVPAYLAQDQAGELAQYFGEPGGKPYVVNMWAPAGSGTFARGDRVTRCSIGFDWDSWVFGAGSPTICEVPRAFRESVLSCKGWVPRGDSTCWEETQSEIGRDFVWVCGADGKLLPGAVGHFQLRPGTVQIDQGPATPAGIE